MKALGPAVLTLAVIAAGIGAWFALDADGTASAHGTNVGQPASPTAAGPKPRPMQAELQEPTKPAPKRDISKLVRFPDGSYLLPLNGCTQGKDTIGWPADRPYAPVIGKETDTRGREWYVHADGSKLTFYLDGGGTTVYLANPDKVLPMDPNDLAITRKAEADKKKRGGDSGGPDAKGQIDDLIRKKD